MRENRGNVAVALPYRQGSTATKPKQNRRPHFQVIGLTTGEKVLYLLSVVVCVALALAVLSQYAEVTELNASINQTETEIRKAKEVNLQLDTEKKKLENTERIRDFAEKNGLYLDTVKSIPSIQP
ncbi:cell division protein FtsL [Thermoflavimicrobium dichotomicum]|uniref:Cell division protein FtsL n=1 Tax=Thermoflavimicrobium dichotomicum TaxID=46223 RepID=A0A1I3N6D5_9BACL|nr:cell division protein FtsL [Thermoflavimicrobium dichotomicum]SFJ04841.1 cell division protein FtsL [Thermoflavimicrobium dichotomicum]